MADKIETFPTALVVRVDDDETIETHNDGYETIHSKEGGSASVSIDNPASENGLPQDPSGMDWLNSASVNVDAAREQVTFAISVADPRGAITMTVRRLPDGSLIMHVPHADETLKHAPYTELHPGTFRIGPEGSFASSVALCETCSHPIELDSADDREICADCLQDEWDEHIEPFRIGITNIVAAGGYETEGDAIYGATELLDYVARDDFEFDGDPADAADLVVGIYWWSAHCYSGQGSDLYALHCKASAVYTPGASESEPERATAAWDAYASLCALSGYPVEPDYWICGDCACWVANGDISGVSVAPGENYTARLREIQNADGDWIVTDHEKGQDDVSPRGEPCDRCGALHITFCGATRRDGDA